VRQLCRRIRGYLPAIRRQTENLGLGEDESYLGSVSGIWWELILEPGMIQSLLAVTHGALGPFFSIYLYTTGLPYLAGITLERSHLERHKSSSDHSWPATHSKPNKLCFGPPCNIRNLTPRTLPKSYPIEASVVHYRFYRQPCRVIADSVENDTEAALDLKNLLIIERHRA